jgi:uncharacterized protein (DUF2461 family)
MLIAGGEYRPPADRLRAIRNHIVNDPNGFRKLMKNAKLNSVFGGLQQEDKTIRMPKGFDVDSPNAEALKLKSYIAWHEISVRTMAPSTLPKRLMDDFKAAEALVKWLRSAGPTL